jgi:hypothetical protein
VGLTSTAPNVISGLAITSDPHYVGSQNNVSVDLPGQAPGRAPGFAITISPPVSSYIFQVHSLTPGSPATLPMTVTDNCGPWQTFVGGGSANTFPTAAPTWTPTPGPTSTPVRTVTTQPTPTLKVLPTATQLPATTVGFFPSKVIQGNVVALNSTNRPNPAVNDYFVITNSSGVQVGPAIYTSSCTTTPGTIAKASATCPVTTSPTLAPGQYILKLFANGGNGLLAQKTGLTVTQSGGALLGRGQLWTVKYSGDDPEFGLTGGFVANQATFNTGDPAYQAPFSYNAVGVSSFGLIGDDFVETGAYKLCTFGGQCNVYPYMSWLDNRGDIQSITWDGFNGQPEVILPASNSAIFRQFKVYELDATRWTAEYCYADLTFSGCCPLWRMGICTPVPPIDFQYAPATRLIRYPWAWEGEETLSERWASGVMRLQGSAVCCKIAQSQWTVQECWDHIWDSFDHNVIRSTVTNCPVPGAWDVVTEYR